MELNSKIIYELKSLRKIYEVKEKKTDLEFITSTLDIFRSDAVFSSIIRYRFDDVIKDPIVVNGNGEITINLKMFYIYLNKYVLVWKNELKDEEIISVKNFYVFNALLHELGHIMQDFSLNDYSEINRLYQDFNEADFNLLCKLIYRIRGCFFAYERNANVFAGRILTDIYDDASAIARVATFSYLDPLLYLYNKKYPNYYTLKLLRLEDDYDLEGIPKIVLLENGFNIEKEIIDYINLLYSKFNNFEIEYNEVKEYLKKL